MRGCNLATLLPVLLTTSVYATEPKQETKPCSVLNSANGHFYDLNAIRLQPPKDQKKAHKDDRTESWHARGYDYDTNFTLNICAPVIEPLESAVDIKESLVRNISAFYTVGKKTYSIG